MGTELFLNLRRAKEKRARYKSHRDFLLKCINNSVIPEGFKIQWKPEMEMDLDIIERCQAVKEDASIKLMELVKEACDVRISSLNESISNQDSQMQVDERDLTDTFERKEEIRVKEVKNRKWGKITSGDLSKFRTIQVKGDGNCFYRCLSIHLYGNEINHDYVRNQIVEYMLDNKNHFQCFVDGDFEKHIKQQTYMDGRTDSWATEAEIFAASSLFNINVKITHDLKDREWTVHTFRTNNDHTENGHTIIPYERSLYLILKNNHFNILIEREDTDKIKISVKQNINVPDWFDSTDYTEVNGSNSTENNVCEKPVTVNEARLKDEDVENQYHTKANKNSTAKKSYKTKLSKSFKPPKTGKQGHEKEYTVTNLSSHVLTDSQISLLSKGLKFIPDRNKVDKIKLLADLGEWERRMRLKEFFYDEENKTQNPSELDPLSKFKEKKKSYFTPGKGRDMCLDMYIELVKNDIMSNLGKVEKLNVSASEQEAFRSLLFNDNIVIRPADKGSGIVVLDKETYMENLTKEMDESSSYTETQEDLTNKSIRVVKTLVNKMHRKGTISKDLKQYLIPRYPKAGTLKGNPKLHKKNKPMRTIVNGINTSTERLAELAEYELNEFVTTSPSYIRDTTDFINKLKEINSPVPEGTILFCFDVCKLYPSVPKLEGLRACEVGLNTRTNPLLPTEDVISMIKVILDNNNFNFANKHYLQTTGIAIGSRLGKNFACSYMRIWDEKLLEFKQKPLFYKRFIDDGIGVWTHGLEALQSFAKHANSIHENIKVELRYSSTKIEFLDTWVHLEDGKIFTSLYRKPTDKQLYLHRSSCHPPSTKSGLAYGLGLRIKRICEKEEDYIKNRQDLKQQLRKRGYSGKSVEKQLTKVDNLKREDLLQKQTKESNESRVPLVLTFSRHLPNIHDILRKHLNVLHRSDKLTKVFEAPPLVAYRRDKNLCDMLVHGKTNKVVGHESNACTCRICSALHDGEIQTTAKTSSYKIVSHARCTDRNLVYALICSKCDKTVYVGETERSLKERVEEHLRDVRNQSDKPIMKHFKLHTAHDVKVAVLQKLYQEGRAYRQLIEEEWIKKLGTKTPHGCNVKLNI